MSIYDETYQLWGVKSQIHKFSEELGELLVVMHHWYDGKATDEQLADEIADVEIVCCQLTNLIDSKLIHEAKILKLKRLRRRIDKCVKERNLSNPKSTD